MRRMSQALLPLLATALGAALGAANEPRPVVHWGGSPFYIPKKHTVQSYRSQQRAAKQRRKAR